ncbi:tetratricopeptide repeat protein, partial [Acinetobacter baumannii]
DGDHGFGEASYNLGVIEFESGNYKEAAVLLDNAARKDSNNSEKQFNCGLAFHKLEKEDLALEAFRKAVSADAKNAPAHYM